MLRQSFCAELVLRNPNFNDKITNFNLSVKNVSQKITITRMSEFCKLVKEYKLKSSLNFSKRIGLVLSSTSQFINV